MKEIIVGKNDVNRRLDSFLIAYMKQIPKSLICKLIRKKRIKINNKKSSINYRLCEGDIISFHVRDEILNSKSSTSFLNVNSELDVVYEDENVLIVNKPSGLICHPDANQKIDCLINRIKKYLFEKNEYNFNAENIFAPALVNRIDRNTQGLVISAKNAESLKILNEKLKNREIKKYYKCLVYGRPPRDEDILVAFLTKNLENNEVNVSKFETPDSRLIKTKYKLLEFKDNKSLLEIELLTGRCHQIRAHLAFIGNPILGDRKYGKSNDSKIKHQLLVSYKIKFKFESSAGILDYLNEKEIKIEPQIKI